MNQPFGNLTRLRQIVAESEFDAVIAVSPENVAYTCGAFIWSQWSIRERLAITVWPKSGDPTLIVCHNEEPQTREETFIADLRTYVEFATSPIEVLADVLREKGLATGRIGTELGYLSTRYFKELSTRVPQAEVSECDHLFAQARMIKTKREIEILSEGAHATERALLATYAMISEGQTEKNLADRLCTNLLLSGALKIAFAYINAGPNTGFPHCPATSYACREGDIVKTDCGGIYQGFVSDVARTGVIGKPSAEQKSIYDRLLEIHHECLQTARPGKKACDIFETMTQGHKRAGLAFPLAHAGHSVGITGHEAPILSPYDATELQPDMTLYIETRIRWPGKEGYHIEDLVRVTEGAPEIVTGAFDTSRLFEI